MFLDLLRVIHVIIWLVVLWALVADWSQNVALGLILSGVALNLTIIVLERHWKAN